MPVVCTGFAQGTKNKTAEPFYDVQGDSMYSILSIGATYFFSTLLKTIASADVVNIANLKNQIVVKNSDGKVLFGKGKVTKFATETYGPTTDNFDFTFICPVDDPSLGGKLTFLK